MQAKANIPQSWRMSCDGVSIAIVWFKVLFYSFWRLRKVDSFLYLYSTTKGERDYFFKSLATSSNDL